MKIRYLIIFCFGIGIENISAQQLSSCTNADFEMNNFTNWVAYTGNCCPVNVNTPGFSNNRHTIVTGPGFDPLSQGNIPLVAPGGGQYSARLGNSNTGAQAEKLSYTFLVTPDNALFIYRYAVVLEDPGHNPASQPRFSIRVFDQNNVAVTCGAYDVVSSANIPGFISLGNLRIKPWTTIGIELTSYIGQYITIEFTTADCGLGGHFGYAYMDCYCSPFTISSDLCPGSNSITLNAPTGFSSYLWSNGDTLPNVTVTNPVLGSIYSCTMTSVTGCQVTLQTVLEPTNLNAAFYTSMRCANETRFIDSSYVVTGSAIQQWEWNFGDGTSSNLQYPVHVYPSAGFYNVQLVVFNSNCSDTISKIIYVKPNPLSDFTFTPECLGDPVAFTDLSTFGAGTITGWDWNFGDGTPNVQQQNPTHAFQSPGPFDVVLNIESDNGCRDSLVKQMIPDIIPSAQYSFVADCDTAQLSFTASAAYSCGPINGYSWNFGDGSPLSTDQNPVHIFPGPGTYTISITIESFNGITGTDTFSVVVPEKLNAEFTATSACLNQPSLYTDQTSLAFGNIINYYWDFGDGVQINGTPTVQHTYLSPGTYNVQHVVLTSSNCTDTTIKQLEVYEMPVADFIADTLSGCEPLPVNFISNSTVTNGSINTLSWYFGSLSGDSVAAPVFSFPAGTHDVTLIAESNYGCLDTFTITGYITAFPLPNPNFTYTPEHITAYIPEVQFYDISDDAISWWWRFGDGTESVDQHPYHRYLNSGMYPVQLSVVSSLGCENEITKSLEVVEEFSVFFPNAFTPNGDGINDYFSANGSSIKQIEMNLFNRWGQLVFTSNNLHEKWNGTDANGNITIGVYTYNAKIVDAKGKTHSKAGTVALLK